MPDRPTTEKDKPERHASHASAQSRQVDVAGISNGVRGQSRSIAIAIFLAVWLSSGWYLQARDWNVASRLMLVYALGDRGSLSIDGLDKQTGDLAFKDGHYYSDKAPGYSLLATPAYFVGKKLFGFADHPLGKDGFPHWPADAWVTWFSSGLATACIAVILSNILIRIDVPRSWAVLAAIAAIWASPLAVYATLAYGHAVSSACMVLAGAMVMTNQEQGISKQRAFVIGFSAGLGVLVELAQAPFAIIIGIVALSRSTNLKNLTDMAVMMILGAIPAALALFVYNYVAFGSPLDMGYFYHATKQFAEVHSAENPLGLKNPDFSKLKPLLWGEYRGLLFYAPWAALAVPGWGLMLRDRLWPAFWISLAGVAVPLWVNLSYPEWTGGWSTGPRLLVTALPWAALAAGYGCRSKFVRFAIVPTFVWGWVINSLCLSVGGRISQDIARPLRDAVVPIWLEGRPPMFWPGEPFARVFLSEWLSEAGLSNFTTDVRLWACILAGTQLIFVLSIIRIGRARP
ncbi:hypothetical protein GC170_18875 [bacterium]|nr:hypothetical protein [bacterium]